MPVKARAGGQGRVRGGRVGAQQGTGGNPSPPTGDPSVGLASGAATVSGVASSSGPVFQVDFTSISSLPTGVSLSRATTGTYFDASGVLQTAAINAPRFNYAWNGSAWVAKGLLSEEQRTNLYLQSGSPANQTITVASGTTYTVSFRGTGTLTLSGATTQTMNGSGANVLTTYTFAASTTSFVTAVSGTITYPNVEAGAFATSHIPTTTAAVIRSADIPTLTGAADTAAKSPLGTIFVETGEMPAVVSANSVIISSTNYFPISRDAASNRQSTYSFHNTVPSVTQADVPSGWQAVNRFGMSHDTTSLSIVNDGGTVVTASGTEDWASDGTIYLGGTTSAGSAINGHLRMLAIYSSRLSDANLQTKSVVGASFFGWGPASGTFGATSALGTVASDSAFETWLGTSVSLFAAWSNSTSWAGMQSSATAAAAQGSNYDLLWTIGFPTSTASLSSVAAGTEDAQYTTLATTIANARPSQSRVIVRPLWECNNSAWAWYGIGNEAVYISAYRRIVTLFLAVSNKFRFDWNFNGTGAAYDVSQLYPGDQYVDVVSSDFYYDVTADGTDSAAALNSKFSEISGLNKLTQFARAHGKPLAISEWGIDTDNAQQFVSGVSEFYSDQSTLAWTDYVDVDNSGNGGYNTRISTNSFPATGTRFQIEFGASPPSRNLMTTFARDFTDSSWTKTNVTIATGQSDLIGGTTAQAIIETAVNDYHLLQRTYTKAASAGTYRVMFKVKPVGGLPFAGMQVFNNGTANGSNTYFDLGTGLPVNGSTWQYGTMGTPIPIYHPLENGFFKIGYELTVDAATDLTFQLKCIDQGAEVHLGTTSKGMIVADAQVRRVV